VKMSSSALEGRSSPVSYVRLQAGLTRETISLPDVELAAAAGNGDVAGQDQTLLAFIRDAAESFVNRRVSILRTHSTY